MIKGKGVHVVFFSGGANVKSARWELAWLENPLLIRENLLERLMGRPMGKSPRQMEVSGENHPFICQHTRPGKQPHNYGKIHHAM